MKIGNCSAIVTGGASGLGEATVCRLHAQGAKVVIVDLNGERGEALAARLGSRALYSRANVASEEDAKRTVTMAVERHGGLNVLVNCAGIGGGKRILGKEAVHDLAHFINVVQTNLVGTFNFLRLSAEVMAKQAPSDAGERGVVVSTASAAAFDGRIGQCAYASSKGGIVAMTLPAARELAQFGIRVNTIAPGLFDTPLLGRLNAETKAALAKEVPFPRRLGRPEEYAQLVQHLIENEMINGETIRLDGALRMTPR